MKKLVIGLVIVGLVAATFVPALVGASERCCKMYQKWYKVSYFDDVHDWVTELVQEQNAELAALELGLDAGRDCFVGFSHMVCEPVLREYRVSYRDGVDWVTVCVNATDSDHAASQLGLRAGKDCFVGHV